MTSKMSYIHAPAKKSLDGRTLPQVIDDEARKHPDREAIVFYAEKNKRLSYTYQQLQQTTLSLAASFLSIGFKPHDRVLVMAPNCLEFVACVFAMARIGVVPLLASTGSRQEQVLATLSRLKARAFVGFSGEDPELLVEVSKAMARNESSSGAQLQANVFLVGEKVGTIKDAMYLDDLIKCMYLNTSEVLKIQTKIQTDDTLVALFTSGSSGQPKAVQHSHFTMVNAGLIAARCGWLIEPQDSSDETNTTSLPEVSSNLSSREIRLFNDRPYHWAGCFAWGITIALTTGSTVVTLRTKKTVLEGDARFVLKILQDEKITHTLIMPYLAHDILAMGTEEFDLSALRFGVLSGQMISQDLLENLLDALPWCTFVNGLGMTELLACGFQFFRKDGKSTNVRDGMTLPENGQLKIVDNDDKVLPVGEQGEICQRGPLLFLGYLEDREETAKVISPAGWFHTSDIGILNSKGKLVIIARKTDVIKRATVKIFPGEIESEFRKHPKIKHAMVVGVPDQRLYEELCACVVVKEGVDFKMAELEEWEEKQWGQTYDEQGLTMKPRYNIFIEAFPETDTGKPSRKKLKLLAKEILGL